MPDRIFAIGDIHGCRDALKALIEAIDPKPDDTIISLGDIIDYGPDSRAAIEQLIELAGRCHLIIVTGNHEQMLFDALNGRDDLRYWESCGGTTTRKCYPDRGDEELIDPDHFAFLKQRCRDYHETSKFIFVHANYFPNRPMPEQDGYTLRWEFVQTHRMAPHYSGKTVVAGHSTQQSGEITDMGYLLLIDTGASMGGWLTALEVDSGEVIQANQQGELRRSKR